MVLCHDILMVKTNILKNQLFLSMKHTINKRSLVKKNALKWQISTFWSCNDTHFKTKVYFHFKTLQVKGIFLWCIFYCRMDRWLCNLQFFLITYWCDLLLCTQKYMFVHLISQNKLRLNSKYVWNILQIQTAMLWIIVLSSDRHSGNNIIL